jgi:hypothetical protein
LIEWPGFTFPVALTVGVAPCYGTGKNLADAVPGKLMNASIFLDHAPHRDMLNSHHYRCPVILSSRRFAEIRRGTNAVLWGKGTKTTIGKAVFPRLFT